MTHETHECLTCAFYTPLGGEGETEGRCKRFPPTHEQSRVNEAQLSRRWPRVWDTEGCGEHSALQGFVVEGNPNHDGPTYLFRLLPK